MNLSKRAAVRFLSLLIVLILFACGVDSITGPANVTLGQNATYDYTWSYGTTLGDAANATNGFAELTVFIPNGWTVVSATYNGTVNGAPVSGNANSMTPAPCVGAAPAGYQAFGFSAGPFASSVGGDNGVFHITYTVGGATGPFTLIGRGSATAQGLPQTCGNQQSLAVTVSAGTPLGITKSFAPAAVAVDTPSTLTFTLSNANAFAANGVAFTDTYPSGLVNAATPNASTTCGGTVTAPAAGGSVALSGATIPASGTCTVSVSVSSSTAASYPNTLAAGGLTSTNATANTATANATLTVTSGAAAAAVPALDPRALALLAAALTLIAIVALKK